MCCLLYSLFSKHSFHDFFEGPTCVHVQSQKAKRGTCNMVSSSLLQFSVLFYFVFVRILEVKITLNYYVYLGVQRFMYVSNGFRRFQYVFVTTFLPSSSSSHHHSLGRPLESYPVVFCEDFRSPMGFFLYKTTDTPLLPSPLTPLVPTTLLTKTQIKLSPVSIESPSLTEWTP